MEVVIVDKVDNSFVEFAVVAAPVRATMARFVFAAIGIDFVIVFGKQTCLLLAYLRWLLR